MEEWLTVPEVAERLKLGRSTVYLLIAQNKIPHVKFGTAVRVPARRLEAWLEARIRGEPAEVDLSGGQDMAGLKKTRR